MYKRQVPIFAGLRFGLYYYYARDRDIRWVQPALFIVLFALGHWVATAAAWAGELSTGGWLWLVPSEPSHGIWAGAARVLKFPIITLIGTDADLPEWLGAPAMLVNSLIWAGAAFLLLKVARGTRARRVAESGQKAPSGG